MELTKILLFALYLKISSHLGEATKMHLHPPPHLYPDQIFTVKQIKENITGIQSANESWEVKEVPTINNHKTTSSTEKLIPHQTSVDMIEEETDTLQNLFTENHNAPSALDQNLGNVLQDINNNVEEEVKAIKMFKDTNKDNIVTTTDAEPSLRTTMEIKTLRKEKSDTNETMKDDIISTINSKLQLSDLNEHISPKQETVILHNPSVQNYSKNFLYRKSNQNTDEKLFSNSSEVNGTKECCVGKYSYHVYSLDTLSTKLEEDLKKEEEKLNEQQKRKEQEILKYQKMEFSQIKFLALNHLQSLNSKHIRGAKVDNISITEAISRSQNMFELVENLNELFKQNKKDIDDPSVLVKTVVDNQIEKCNEIYETKIKHNTYNKTLANIENNKTFMRFMKCVNMNLKICLKNFTLWLKTKKFYLRPQLKISKAYKNYERIYSLSCS